MKLKASSFSVKSLLKIKTPLKRPPQILALIVRFYIFTPDKKTEYHEKICIAPAGRSYFKFLR